MAFYQRIHRFGYYLTWTPVAILFSETVATLHWSSSSHTHMAPHIPPKSLCLVRPSWINRHAYLGHGHVVLVKSPNRSCPPLLRRVIALGGDYVEPSSFKQYLIYQQQKETQTQTQAETDITFVPPGFVWLEPDHCTNAHNNNNNSNSNDYECNGLVPISLIIGRVTHILPSGRSIPTIPSKRAFPSANHQMYPATATATATINR